MFSVFWMPPHKGAGQASQGQPLTAAADAEIGKDGETSLIIERVDAHGNVTTMDL
jgi:hypothetical protein